MPKKNPTAHSRDLSSDTAMASATTLLDCNTQELDTYSHVLPNMQDELAIAVENILKR